MPTSMIRQIWPDVGYDNTNFSDPDTHRCDTVLETHNPWRREGDNIDRSRCYGVAAHAADDLIRCWDCRDEQERLEARLMDDIADRAAALLEREAAARSEGA